MKSNFLNSVSDQGGKSGNEFTIISLLGRPSCSPTNIKEEKVGRSDPFYDVHVMMTSSGCGLARLGYHVIVRMLRML